MTRIQGEVNKNIGEINKVQLGLPKEITCIQATLNQHTDQLERIERHQKECACEDQLGALMEMIRSLEARLNQHEVESDQSHLESRTGSIQGQRDKTFHPQHESTLPLPKRDEVPKGAKVKKPDPYDRQRGQEAKHFLTKMEIYFLVYDNVFTDQRKIMATLSNTTKTASAWTQNFLTKLVQKKKHPSLQ